MSRESVFEAACKVANLAVRVAGDNLSDAKQILHVAISLIHSDESERREQSRNALCGCFSRGWLAGCGLPDGDMNRNYSTVYERKLEAFKRRQANKRKIRRNLKNKWYLRRYRLGKKMDRQAAQYLSRFDGV